MAKLADFDKQLTALWGSDFRRGWLKVNGLSLYLRRGFHSIEGAITPCLDIASVLAQPKGKGKFTWFLDWLEIDFMPRTGGIIFVENVLNERLRGFLLRRGYTKDARYQHYLKKVAKRETD